MGPACLDHGGVRVRVEIVKEEGLGAARLEQDRCALHLPRRDDPPVGDDQRTTERELASQLPKSPQRPLPENYPRR